VLEPNPSIHNSTFGGNPLACTAASACIEVLLEEHLPARAAVMGNYFMRKFNELKDKYPGQIADVRGRGLLIGLEWTSKELREKVQVELFHRGVLVAATMNANRTMRIEPPLIITESQINLMIDTLEGIISEIGEAELVELNAVAADEINAHKKSKASAPKVRRRRVACPRYGMKLVLAPVKKGKKKNGSKKKGSKLKASPSKDAKSGKKNKKGSGYKSKGRK
jgi:hypothetical protein